MMTSRKAIVFNLGLWAVVSAVSEDEDDEGCLGMQFALADLSSKHQTWQRKIANDRCFSYLNSQTFPLPCLLTGGYITAKLSDVTCHQNQRLKDERT